jgi:hypothetical protein
MSEREALELVQRLLSDAVAQELGPHRIVRDLASHIGDLHATIRAALTIISLAFEETDR